MPVNDTLGRIMALLRAKACRHGPYSTSSLMSPDEIALRLQLNRRAIHEDMRRLLAMGDVVRVRHGWYRITQVIPIFQATIERADREG